MLPCSQDPPRLTSSRRLTGFPDHPKGFSGVLIVSRSARKAFGGVLAIFRHALKPSGGRPIVSRPILKPAGGRLLVFPRAPNPLGRKIAVFTQRPAKTIGGKIVSGQPRQARIYRRLSPRSSRPKESKGRLFPDIRNQKESKGKIRFEGGGAETINPIDSKTVFFKSLPENSQSGSEVIRGGS